MLGPEQPFGAMFSSLRGHVNPQIMAEHRKKSGFLMIGSDFFPLRFFLTVLLPLPALGFNP